MLGSIIIIGVVLAAGKTTHVLQPPVEKKATADNAMTTPSNVSYHDGSCIDGGEASTITVRLPPGLEVESFAWPPLPPSGSEEYSFALDSAVLTLPAACARTMGLSPNTNNGPGREENLWLGRLSEVEKANSFSACGHGVVIMCCGSGGCTGDNVKEMRSAAAAGYAVLAIDSMASPSPSFSRRMPFVANLSATIRAGNESYWCAKSLYTGGCDGADSGGPYPACFSSKWDRIVYDPLGWAAFYERIYTLRERELNWVMEHMAARLGTPTRLFLMGQSEGGMLAARYTHPKLAEFGMAGRILTEWSCEFVYFVSCAKHAEIATDPAVPVFNSLSAVDPFFGSGAVLATSLSEDTLNALFAYDSSWNAKVTPFRGGASPHTHVRSPRCSSLARRFCQHTSRSHRTSARAQAATGCGRSLVSVPTPCSARASQASLSPSMSRTTARTRSWLRR